MQAIACLPEERAAALSRVAEQERIEELRLRCGEGAKRAHRRGGAPAVARAGDGGRAARNRQPRGAVLGTQLCREHAAGFSAARGRPQTRSVRHSGLRERQRHGRAADFLAQSARSAQIDALDDILAPYIGEGAPFSLLVLAPPGCGKTTLVREWVRLVSDAGHTTAVADERGEIAGLAEGVPQFRIGRCTDILEGCTKKQAALMLLRTMSPALVAMDEITSPEDIEAVALCAHCGTAVLAAAHAAGPSDLRRRPLYRRLLSLGVFERVLTIEQKDGKRSYRMEKTEGTTC